jgi:hypothetical protein
MATWQKFECCVSYVRRDEPGSSVSTVSGYGLDDQVTQVRSPAETKDLSSNLWLQTGSGVHPASCTMGTSEPFPGTKARPGRWALVYVSVLQLSLCLWAWVRNVILNTSCIFMSKKQSLIDQNVWSDCVIEITHIGTVWCHTLLLYLRKWSLMDRSVVLSMELKYNVSDTVSTSIVRADFTLSIWWRERDSI